MGARLSLDDSVRVVVVGGGFGGTAAASLLKSWAVPFVLVDVRDAFHHNVAALRAAVESGFAKKTFISYSVTFGDSFRQGRVVGIDPGRQKVLLSDGEELHYSHLIIATGSDGPFPGKFNQVIDMESAIQTYEDMVKEIEKSQRILVVGGGAAGVEMAAEIKTEYPDKEVILIHSKPALADVELLPSVRQEVKEILLRKGVRLLLGDKMASNGALKVNEYLQLEGYENIYAIGDCADLREPKMAYHAGLHADVVVTNIINSLTQKPLKTYKPGSLTFLLSMGRNDGVGQVNGYYVGRLLVTMAKSRGLFVSKSWKTMGQTMPS
ncbi:PREDICTED: apoptosis-inducing factor 2 isoform X2 [Ficedula albicollis]|uniref:apoptosis-inducing factor 2 isoform X2 n=1 Tax=Ficedula albicollis TaxID=59894 RepID=UPI000359F813|nr:PREDICTED: apoptosis-inducing factor 2 isoform X2 [Ficedula albicollis]